MALATLTRSAAIAALVLALPPAAQAQRLDAGTLRAYGGTYSTDCANPGAPKLVARADMLAVERGNQRMSALKPQAAPGFFGNSPPRNYLMTLLGEVRGRYQMVFVVYQDRQGKYAVLDGDPQVRQALGSLVGPRYKRCGDTSALQAQAAPARPVPPQRAPVQPPPSAGAAADASSPPSLLRDARFRTPYYRALGAKQNERWLARLDGPAPQPRTVRVAGTEYLLVAVCKPRDCGDNSTVLLYSAPQGVVYGQIHERGRNTLIGGPPPAVAAELGKLWRAEWRPQ